MNVRSLPLFGAEYEPDQRWRMNSWPMNISIVDNHKKSRI